MGFLKENDQYCQNQTIRPANDVWLRTTAPLPVVYELNEPTGSENRKSKQKERRNYVRKHALQRDSAGKLASEISHWSPRNSGTVSSYHVGAACPCFQQLTELHCKTFWLWLSWFTSVENHTQKSGSPDGKQSGGKNLNVSLTGSLKPHNVCDFICLSLPGGAAEPSDLDFELAYTADPVWVH